MQRVKSGAIELGSGVNSASMAADEKDTLSDAISRDGLRRK